MGQTTSVTDRFRALIITPAYEGTRNQLNGTINDGKAWFDFFTKRAQVPKECVRWLSDSSRYKEITETSYMKNIVNALEDLVKWANSVKDPVIFISYSGHGTHQVDMSGDEEDGMDEGWVSTELGFVSDDYLNSEFLGRLPKRARVFAFNDACYNGTVWDTKYSAMYVGSGKPHMSKHSARKLGEVTEVRAAQSQAAPAAQPIGQGSVANGSLGTLMLVAMAVLYALSRRSVDARMYAVGAAVSVVLLLGATRRAPAHSAQRPAASPVQVYTSRAKTATYAETDTDRARNGKVKSRYDAHVNSHAAPSSYRQVVCKFSGLSSSNDKQVSYEGGKNGFFSYEVHTILNREILPLLEEKNDLDHVLKHWARSGYSLVVEIGDRLKRMGIPQNPMWQVIDDKAPGESTSFFLE